MPLNQFSLIGERQSGRSLIAIGAAKEFIRQYGPDHCAIFWPQRHMADYAAKKYQLPREVTFSVGLPDEDIEYALIGKTFIVCEDISHWPMGKLNFFVDALDRRQRDLNPAFPRTIIKVY